MNKPTRKKRPLFKIANNALVDLPTPSTISGWWNFGSLLGICLVEQIITGLFLAIHFSPNIDTSFSRVRHICRDVNYGLLRTLCANGTSLFFVCIYLHTGRKLYYGSYNFIHTWSVGIVILFLTIATSFIWYVLPWRQISFRGAILIPNLLSAIPNRLMSMRGISGRWRHTIFLITLPNTIRNRSNCIKSQFLHQTGSNNPLGLNKSTYKIPFSAAFLVYLEAKHVLYTEQCCWISCQEPYPLVYQSYRRQSYLGE